MGNIIRGDFKKKPKSFEYSEERAAEIYDNYRRAQDRYNRVYKYISLAVNISVLIAILVLFS